MSTFLLRGATVLDVLEPFTSLADYDRWCAQRPEGEFYEVVEGIPILSPGPTGRHQLVLLRLAFAIREHVPSTHEIIPAPWDWLLSERPLHIRQPDLVVVHKDDVLDRLTTTPLLAVEVLSASSVERDMFVKRRLYAHAGLEHYWVVDPLAPRVLAYRRDGDDMAVVADVTSEDVLALTEPFAVEFAPADLLR